MMLNMKPYSDSKLAPSPPLLCYSVQWNIALLFELNARHRQNEFNVVTLYLFVSCVVYFCIFHIRNV